MAWRCVLFDWTSAGVAARAPRRCRAWGPCGEQPSAAPAGRVPAGRANARRLAPPLLPLLPGQNRLAVEPHRRHCTWPSRRTVACCGRSRRNGCGWRIPSPLFWRTFLRHSPSNAAVPSYWRRQLSGATWADQTSVSCWAGRTCYLCVAVVRRLSGMVCCGLGRVQAAAACAPAAITLQLSNLFLRGFAAVCRASIRPLLYFEAAPLRGSAAPHHSARTNLSIAPPPCVAQE